MQYTFELLLAATLLYITAQWTQRLIYRYSGKAGLYGTAIIGVPIHELSHAMVATATGLKVTEISLFSPNPQTGWLGHVHFTYNPRSLWQRAAVGLTAFAPLPGSGAVIYLIYTTTDWRGEWWEPALAGYIILSTFIHGFPSVQDLRTSLQAIPIIFPALVGYTIFLAIQ